MRIIVTGATGFLGKNTVIGAAEMGWEVIAVVRRNCQKASCFDAFPNVHVMELNMDEYAELGNVAGTGDCFVHFAWNGTHGVQRMDETLQRRSFADSVAAVKSVLGAGCRKVILAGSQAEYGPQKEQVTEETPCAPNTAYGCSKLDLYRESKRLCALDGAACCEARIFSVYGNGDFPGTLIMSAMDKLRRHEEMNLTECVQMWDYVYIKDVVSAFLLLCQNDHSEGVYNLGSGDARMLKSYIVEMRELLHSKSRLNFGAVSYPSTGMVHLYPSVIKLQNELKWKAKWSFRDGIRDMLNG